MKKWIALILICAFVGGCAGFTKFSQSAEEFFEDNPKVDPGSAVDFDVTGDGSWDFTGFDGDGDGEPDLDSSGKPIELPGSRERFAQAGQLDLTIAGLLGAVGLFGVPGGAVAQRLWLRFRPAKRTVHAENVIRGMILSAEKIRQSAKDNKPMAIGELNKIFAAVAKDVPGFINTVEQVKKELKLGKYKETL